MTTIVRRLARDREAARARLLEGMDSPRYVALLDRLTEAASQPEFAEGDGRRQGAADALPGLVRRPRQLLSDRGHPGLPERAWKAGSD